MPPLPPQRIVTMGLRRQLQRRGRYQGRVKP